MPAVLQSRVVARSELELGKRLGQGAFGVVCKGVLRGETVAVKQLDLEHVRHTLGFGPQQACAAFYWESVNLALVDHPGLVALRGVCVEGDFRAVILEFCSGGDMERALHADTATVWRWSLQLAEALRFLHANGQVAR